MAAGELAWAKIKGYPWWPARVEAVRSSTVDVLFFGTQQQGRPKVSDVVPFASYASSPIHIALDADHQVLSAACSTGAEACEVCTPIAIATAIVIVFIWSPTTCGCS